MNNSIFIKCRNIKDLIAQNQQLQKENDQLQSFHGIQHSNASYHHSPSLNRSNSRLRLRPESRQSSLITPTKRSSSLITTPNSRNLSFSMDTAHRHSKLPLRDKEGFTNRSTIAQVPSTPLRYSHSTNTPLRSLNQRSNHDLFRPLTGTSTPATGFRRRF